MYIFKLLDGNIMNKFGGNLFVATECSYKVSINFLIEKISHFYVENRRETTSRHNYSHWKTNRNNKRKSQ
jgi:hypothetical protein